MRYHEQTGLIELGIKSFGTFTKKLDQLQEGDTVYLQGPYGVFLQDTHTPKVCIAGGIGITPFVQYIEYNRSSTYLFSCMRTKEQALLPEYFRSRLGDHFVEIYSEDALCPQRLTKEIVQNSLPHDYVQYAHFYICGPKGLMKSAKMYLSELGVAPQRIFTEDFVL